MSSLFSDSIADYWAFIAEITEIILIFVMYFLNLFISLFFLRVISNWLPHLLVMILGKSRSLKNVTPKTIEISLLTLLPGCVVMGPSLELGP